MADSQFLDLETARELRKKLDTPPTVDRNPGIKAAIGKHGGVSWMKELLQALRAPGKLTIDEYFYYRLYDLPRDEMLRFVGKKAQAKMHSACNNVQWFALCHDKAVFYTALLGAGMPVPETIAVHEPRGRAGCFEVLRDEEQLRGFFSDPSNYPLFAKPVDGIYSIGAFHLKEVVGNQIALADGTLVGLDDVIAFVRQLTQEGYLFQKVLTPNPAYRETFAGGLPAIRFLVLLEENGPRVESAVVKIPRTGSSADNYWRGNMLGAVDIENGRICRVVTGYGEELSEVDTHPDTAASFTDLALVEWAEAMRLCLEAATMFPGIRTQSWDVALTSAGPVLLELNFGGDLNLHQLAHRRGMLSQAFASHLRRCGYKGRLPVEKPASDQG